MYQEVIDNIKAQEAQGGGQALAGVLGIVKQYNDMDLIVQIHSHEKDDELYSTIRLVYRPSSSVEIRKIVNVQTGEITDWHVIDLSEAYNLGA